MKLFLTFPLIFFLVTLSIPLQADFHHRHAGLKPYVTEFSQNAQHQISVTFANIPFESCMHWLEKVQQNGWMVKTMSASKGEKSGIVNLSMVLG